MIPTYRVLEVLEDVVLDCGKLILSLREDDQQVQDKDEQLGAHFSTLADRKSLERGLSIFHDLMPGEVIIAEEKENVKEVLPDCTVFDPMDGTTNYYNGIDDFGVTVCTFRDGQPVCSATYFPMRAMIIKTSRGTAPTVGTSRGLRQIKKIPWHGRIDKAQIGTDVGSWSHVETAHKNVFETILRPLSQRFNILSSMAAIEGGRRVLFGQTGAYYNLGIAKIWDAAAMSLAIQEAGGIVCDPYGNPLQWETIDCDWVMAINQQFADIVLEHTQHWPGRP